jgi:hypothetical protein
VFILSIRLIVVVTPDKLGQLPKDKLWQILPDKLWQILSDKLWQYVLFEKFETFKLSCGWFCKLMKTE